MEQIKVTIETLAPVVLTKESSFAVMTETNESFSGAILRGVFAARYIAQQKLGKRAHEDAGFQQMFFGGLRFVDAYPVAGGERARLLPASLQKNKEGNEVQDLLQAEGKTGFKSYRGFGVIQESKVCPVAVRKSIELHMSRLTPGERLSGKSIEGNVYNYEAIDAGQCFEGEILGERKLLEDFVTALQLEGNVLDCYIGRSKYTQYGSCRITLGKPQAVELPQKLPGDTLLLQLDTPLIPAEGSAADAPAALQAALGRDFSVDRDRVFASVAEIDNFVGVWGMKRPRQTAVAAGAIFALQKADCSPWSDSDRAALEKLLYGGLGQRTEEGFGQLRLWDYGKLTPGKSIAEAAPAAACGVTNKKVKALAKAIFMRRILANVRQYAAADAANLTKLKDTAHLFARLESLLGDKKDLAGVQQRFLGELQGKLADGKKIDQHLHAIKLDGKELYDLLQWVDGWPHKDGWKADLPVRTAEFMQEIGLAKPAEDALYYEYWHWLFRHARKQAATQARQTAAESGGTAK